MNRYKVRELMDALLEGEISEADFLTLEAQLAVDDELRKEYLQRVTLTTLLEAEAASAEVDNFTSSEHLFPKVLPVSANTSWSRYATGALLAVALCGMAFSLWSKTGSSSNARSNSSNTSVASNTTQPTEEEVAAN